MVLVGLTLAEAAWVETARAQAEAMLAAPGAALGLYGSREAPLAWLESWLVWGFGAGPSGLASATVLPLGTHTSAACQEQIFRRIVECNETRIKREMPFRATKKDRLLRGCCERE